MRGLSATFSPNGAHHCTMPSSTPVCNPDNWTHLWKVDTDPPAYFFGTNHNQDYGYELWITLPENVKQAFLNSDEVYFEGLQEQIRDNLHSLKTKNSNTHQWVRTDAYRCKATHTTTWALNACRTISEADGWLSTYLENLNNYLRLHVYLSFH